MAFDVDLASTYFMRRLSETRQAQQLTASMQFDLARSPLSDDELEDIVDQFRDSPRPREGWGLSGVLNEVLSTQPKRIPVQDLQKLQANLIANGYAPPDAVANGIWDPAWYASFRRFDRDNFEEQRAGQHWYSAPVESGMRALVNTLPSRVFQGIVGGAKGLVEQTGETAQRVGALGGAAAGAGIGTLVAPGLGTAVGAGVGAAIGFFGDLFFDDPGEEGQSFPGALVDALTPWEEYAANPKAAWEDLGYVLTVGSFVSGFGAAGRGITSGAAALKGAVAGAPAGVGRSTLPGIFGAAEGAATRAAVPGMSWAKAAMLPTKAAAQTELGAFGTLVRAATRRMHLMPGTQGAVANTLARYSPIAFANRVGPKIALDVFGGLSQAQMGARLFGGIGQGTSTKLREARDAMKAELGRDLTEEEELSLQKTVAGSTIEKAIANAPTLKSGVEIPLLGDMVDLAAFMLYPQRLLPFSGHRAAQTVNRLLKADHLLLAYAHSIADEKKIGLLPALREAKELIDPLENTRLRMEYGVHAESHLRVARAFSGREGAAFERGAMKQARADTVREITRELERGGKGQSETLRRVMAYSEGDPTGFEAWLKDLNTQGRGLSRLQDNREANRMARKLMRDLNREKAVIVRNDDGTPRLVWGVDTARVRTEKVSRDLDITTVDRRIGELTKRAEKLERYASTKAASPGLTLAARDAARIHRFEIDSLQKTLEGLKAANKKKLVLDDVRLAPARVDFADKQTILQKRDEFIQLRDELLNAQTPNAKVEARQVLDNYVRELETQGFITERQVKTALAERPGKAIATALERQAQSAAARFELPPELEQQFSALGYKVVETGEDVVFPDQIEGMMELVGVGDYTRRAAFWESLGLSALRRADTSISDLSKAATKAEMQDVLRKRGIKLSPQAALSRLYRYLDSRNHDGAVFGPIRKPKQGRPGLYGTNVRDLSVEDVYAAFEDIPGMTHEVAKDIYGALRRGSAYGAEAHFMHPLDSFRGLAHAMRINGAPGISDLMRTLHAEVPTRLNRKAWRQGIVKYEPPAHLATSPARKRVETAIHEVALRSTENITPGQRSFTMALMDSMAEAQVRAGRFENVDEVYERLDVAFAERYLGGAQDALFKRIEAQPSFEDLRLLARAYEDTKEWYEESAKAISELPLYGRHTLADGREISDQELFVNILAAVSPQKPVERDVIDAWRHFKSIKSGDLVWGGATPAERGMLDDIVAGKTIDTWGPARTTRTTKAGKERGVEHHGRQKVENFYQNLKGDLERVTNDGWIAKLFGFNGELSLKQYDDITLEIKRVAEDLGWYPAHVQAALWAAKRDEAASGMRLAAIAAEDAGDFAEAARLRAAAPKYEKATIGQYTDEIFAEAPEVNGYALLQSVEDQVNGLTQFGPDFENVMRFFRTADFSTLVHENAHVLRRLLAPEDLARLERAYGVRKAMPPEGASDELRDIARAYHEESGIPFDRTAVEEYVDVDEARAMRIADAYEAAKSNKKGPTKKAYKAFVNETMAQYRMLISRGYKLVPWAEGDAPYKGAAEFIRDVRDNKRLYFYKTTKDQIPADHPLAADAGFSLIDSQGNAWRMSHNDVFRAVHDIFGHAKEGVQTGARGEENAWRQHARMYSETARRAMTTETRGQNSWVNFGPHLRQAGKVAKKGDEGFVPPQDRPYAEQKAFLLPEEFSQIDQPFAWPREAEERFARDAERYILGKARLGGDESIPSGVMDLVRHGLNTLWANVRHTAVETNRVPRAARAVMDQYFGEALKLRPESRAVANLKDVRSKQVLAGGAIGAGVGAVEGEGLEDALEGGLRGAAIGFVGRKALKATYGYLPDALQRMNTALRYTLSFTFDLGRLTEQNMIAMAKFNLPPMASPVRYTKSKAWRSPFRAGEVRGEQAWEDAVRLYDEINGPYTFATNIDDLDRRLYQAGMLGFSPRNWEIAQTWQLWQRGMPAEQIRENVALIGRYGLERTAAEKTANFIVFPFSFSKKLLSTMGDFVLQHPGRNLLLHEGMKRYEASEYDDRLEEFLKKHAPLLEELKTVNNLAFGISPGRFLFAGLEDHRTDTGKAAQLVSSFFVPSGAATSLAQAAGNAADLAINAFVPIVITGESINRAGGIEKFSDIMRRYIPFVRELDQYFIGSSGQPGAVSRQLTALSQGADPYYQFSAYQDDLRRLKAEYEPFALAMGYQSADGLMQSAIGAPFAADLDAKKEELNGLYPAGFRMSQEFTNTDTIDAQALVDLANKENRTEGEDHILEIAQHISQQKAVGELVGFDPQLVAMTTAQSVRTMAARYARDHRFLELWDRFFLREYGPLRRVA